MTRVLAIARRELGAYFASPIAYIVGVLFLVVQGFSFWAVAGVLADPQTPAPMGAVLRTHFGGTFLYWSFVFMLVSTTAMRLVAEDRRQGTWEALLTTPVAEGEAIVGKWLGACAYYAALWLPTVAYALVVRHYAPPGSGPELGPIASAYLGVALTGAAFLAVGIAASAATHNQIVAAVATFVGLMALLLAGQLDELAPDWARDHAGAASWLAAVDVRDHMDRFARGDIDLRVVTLYVGVTAAGLAAATALAGLGRRPRSELASRGLAAGLIALIAVLATAVAARHPAHWDVTGRDVNSLAEPTRDVLDRVGVPVEVTIVYAGEPGFEPIYDEVRRVLARMARAQPRLTVTELDPVRSPQRFRRLAADFGIPEAELAGGGAVAFFAGDRVTVVELLDMATFGRDEIGAGAVTRFRAEEAFATATARVIEAEQPVVCALRGHGEVRAEPLVRALARDGVAVRPVADAADIDRTCQVVAVLGPRRSLPAGDAMAIARYLDGGGRLLLAVDIEPATHGLELVLASRGVRALAAVAVDPVQRVAGVELGWGTFTGYGDHPITRGFSERRATVWAAPRVLAVDAPAVPLVSTSPTGWGETNIRALFGDQPVAADERDVMGPVAIAAAVEDPKTGARIAVFGSAESIAGELAASAGGNARLATVAVAWLVGRRQSVSLGDRTPERVRLMMTAGQLRGVFITCVVAIPLAWVLIGAVVWWRRRRPRRG